MRALELERNPGRLERRARERLGVFVAAILGGVLLLALAGCSGSPAGPDDVETHPKPETWSIAQPAPSWAAEAVAQRWALVTSCAHDPGRRLAGQLVLHPGTWGADGFGFDSPYGRVSGYFVTPTREVHVLADRDFVWAWDHELVHLLLDLQTGDADIKHLSPLFHECAA